MAFEVSSELDVDDGLGFLRQISLSMDAFATIDVTGNSDRNKGGNSQRV
jgi:hypothetical protein